MDKNFHKLVYSTEIAQYIMCDEVGVLSITKNLDTQAMVISFYHHTVNNYGKFEGTLSNLHPNKIYNFLTSKGIVVFDEFKSTISNYLTEQVMKLVDSGQIKYIHERVGFVKDNDYTKGYLASKSISAAYSSVMRNNDDQIIGSYGSRSIYDDMIQKEVIPNKSLHLPLILGFSAPLVPIMFDKTACPVLMTNFAGKSSQGKSTSLMLIASIWGKGFISNTRLAIAKTFTSTQNGFEATVNSNFGFPVIYDDYETAPKHTNFGQLIYTLAQGESKTRCDKTGRVLDTFQWRTYIGLSGESSIFDRAGNNLGLKPRIVEFKNTKWTVSKNNSINITGTIINNYGFYGEEFVEKLMKVSKANLDIEYANCEKIINKLVPPKDNISDRIQTRLALIRLTAILVRDLMDLDIDVDYITDVLVQNEKTRQVNLDVFQLAKENLIEYVNSNLSSFVRFDNRIHETVVPNTKIVGRIYKGQQGNLVAILPEYFEKKIMASFNDKEAILECWRDEGFLIADKDGRYQKKVRISSFAQAPRCYTFAFDKVNNFLSDLIDEDVVELRRAENKDMEMQYDRSRKNIIYKNGEEYVRIPKNNDERHDIVVKSNVEMHEPYLNEEIIPIREETVINTPQEIKFDDESDIDAIFGNKPDNTENE